MADVGVLLPVRIETRFKEGDLWLRVVPDEPWFLTSDGRIGDDELAALQRYAAAPQDAAADGVPLAWRQLAAEVGSARAVDLHRRFVTTAPDGTLAVRPPAPGERRDEPVLPAISGFPTDLAVWLADGAGLREVLRLAVDRSRLLADFADPDVPGDTRWWEDWDEAVAVGMAGVVPAASLSGPIEALYVTGLGDGDPAAHFAALVAEGRVGLLEPGTPTNSVDGAPAAPLGNDPATAWRLLTTPAGDTDRDVSAALTGDPARLGNMPGGDRPHRAPRSALTDVVYPALWGFAAEAVFDLVRGRAPAAWAARAMFPEGAYPPLRIGPQPYGLVPATAWSEWAPAADEPSFEAPLLQGLVQLRRRHAGAARARGTAAGQGTDGLLDLIADTPTSPRLRYRHAWPIELWWLGMVGAGVPQRWRDLPAMWSERYPLADRLGLRPARRYGARGRSRRVGVPLVLPRGVSEEELPDLLDRLADAALATPSTFADAARLETEALGGRGDSVLVRLAVRSLQLLIAETVSVVEPVVLEHVARGNRAPGRLQERVAAAGLIDRMQPSGAKGHVIAVADALRSLGAVPVRELERMLVAAVDCADHRIDPWLLAAPQRRLDDLQAAGGADRRLGAYGWVDGPAPGAPGPTAGGLLHAPSSSAALAAAVLRDRAVSDPATRWDLDITSRSARTADRLAEHVRIGAHLSEALGREVERIVGNTLDVEALRRQFPVRTEHEGRRVCDGLRVLAANPFPVALDAEQEAAVRELRDGIDTYADLLVADAVHHLVEGRAEVAGAVMDGAAGLSRPPELSLLRTPRDGRAVSTSVLLALPHVGEVPLPAGDAARAVLSPAAVLDPSVAAWLADEMGDAPSWDFEVQPADGGPRRTVTLADLGLRPVDALALTLTRLEQLAGPVVGGSGGARYEEAARLVALVGRAPGGDVVDPSLPARYAAVREVGLALARSLRAAIAGGDAGGAAAFVRACAAWGIAPEGGDAGAALALLDARLAASPDATAAAGLSRGDLVDAAAALVSPTGQVAITATVQAAALPSVARAEGLDESWLTVVAAVRPRLAPLEVHQLRASAPLHAWATRPGDPWQADRSDPRPLLAVYAPSSVDLAAGGEVAVAAVDRFSEVIPAAEQFTGAAFGFDAPAARAQQAILLAVPPDVGKPLDHATLARILAETRELAHARMARPVDLDDEHRALFPTALLPASGAMATILEPRS